MDHLILVPTRVEVDCLQRSPEFSAGAECAAPGWRIELCGFGPVVSGARTMQLLCEHRPKHVWLVGIAGSYGDKLAVGKAFLFDEVICHGVGVGEAGEHISAQQLGWQQWSCKPTIQQRLPLAASLPGLESTSRQPTPGIRAGRLLSVCSASANFNEAERRLQQYPSAVAEDMEGFAVAAACRLKNTPCTIVRGISNQAGDREHDHWQIAQAMNSVAFILAGKHRSTTA